MPDQSAPAQIGTLTRNTEPHQKCWSRKPPRIGPIAMPMADTPAHTPIARPRSRASVNMLVMIDNVAGMMNAPPMPMTARAIVSVVVLSAKDAASDAPPKMASPTLSAPRSTEPISQAPRGEEHPGEHEHVGVDDPLEIGGRGVEVADEGRERDVEDRGVDPDDGEAATQHADRPPSAVGMSDEVARRDEASEHGTPVVSERGGEGFRYATVPVLRRTESRDRPGTRGSRSCTLAPRLNRATRTRGRRDREPDMSIGIRRVLVGAGLVVAIGGASATAVLFSGGTSPQASGRDSVVEAAGTKTSTSTSTTTSSTTTTSTTTTLPPAPEPPPPRHRRRSRRLRHRRLPLLPNQHPLPADSVRPRATAAQAGRRARSSGP